MAGDSEGSGCASSLCARGKENNPKLGLGIVVLLPFSLPGLEDL